MKPKTMILMCVAVGCGLAASYMTSQLLAERGNSGPEQVEEKVKILVAKSNLELGLLIEKPEELFKVKLYLKGQEPEKALTDADFGKLKDCRLSKPLKTDEFVTIADLIDKNQNSLSARLPKGMRAVGIKVNIESIAGGFASLPLSHVDIISVLRRGDGDSLSQILLEDVLVLAADQETQRPGDGRSAMPANTVTVSLPPEDAELVTLAQEMGSLRLVLRAFGDSTPAKTHGATGQMITKGHQDRKKERLVRADNDNPVTEAAKVLLKKVLDVKEKKPVVVVKKVEAPPVKVEPKTYSHILTIYNGDQGKRHHYKLDDKGKVLDPEVTKLEPEPKAPVIVQPKKQPVKRLDTPTG